MVRLIFGGLLVVGLGTALSGCVIENCEEGADCRDDAGSANSPGKGHADETEQCTGYCDRLSVCGAPQAQDFDACVKACEVRFEKLPEQTAELCACIVASRCEDAVEGRCSEEGAGGSGGGSSGHGGTSGHGGSSSTGGSGTGGSTSTGGATSSGGTSSSGGAASTGGSHSGGGSSNGGSAASSGGSGAGGSSGAPCTAGAGGEPGEPGGAGGEPPPLACTCDCDCPEPQTCVEGYCAG